MELVHLRIAICESKHGHYFSNWNPYSLYNEQLKTGIGALNVNDWTKVLHLPIRENTQTLILLKICLNILSMNLTLGNVRDNICSNPEISLQ